MNYFDLLTDDIIIKIIDRICDEIEVNLDELEVNLDEIAVEVEEIEATITANRLDYEDYMQDIWWRDHWNTLDRNTDDLRYHPDNGDPYDTDELDQFYQDEMYLNNLSSNI